MGCDKTETAQIHQEKYGLEEVILNHAHDAFDCQIII